MDGQSSAGLSTVLISLDILGNESVKNSPISPNFPLEKYEIKYK